MPVQPVILAAGDSRRMGYAKALLPLGASTFLGRILEALSLCPLPSPIVVLGRHAERIRAVLPGKATVCLNPDPDRGQLSSLLLALDSTPAECRGCLVWPVDQPLVTEATVQGILRLFEETDASLALPVCGGMRGHPAIFHRRTFAELRELGPLGNPKPVIQRHAADTVLFETDCRGTVDDIDTPEDYERWIGESLDSALKKRVIV